MRSLLVALLAVPALAAAQPAAPAPDRPPVSANRIAGQLLFGSLTAAAGGTAFVLAADRLADQEGVPRLAIAAVIGIAIGAPIGVQWAGDSDDAEGSVTGTIAGSLVGLGVGVGVFAIDYNNATLALLVASPVLGATIGHTVTRRYKHGAATIALTPGIAPIADGIGVSLASGTF